MEESEVLRMDGQPLEICPDKVVSRVAYHEKLNVILVGTADGCLHVVDPTLGESVYVTKIGPDEENKTVNWDFSVCPEKLIVVEGDKVGIRSDYNGILLLSSILQTPLSSSSDVVQIELSKSEAESLCHSLPTADSVETDVSEVEKQLKAVAVRELEPGTPLILVKREKWSTVKLELPYSTLKSTFQTMVNELWKKNAYIPQLSIASSILERLNMLLPSPKDDPDIPLEKAQMFSESARLRTFSNWPHMEYRFAFPSKMAEAGFYYSPSANGEDRAMCFTCNVCLVSWEPTDEPWSEHERHSPFCPFVRGEASTNVPLSLSLATCPAFVVPEMGSARPILGKSSCPVAAVVAYSNGHIVVWDVAKEAKPVVRFTLTPEVLASTTPLDEMMYCDVEHGKSLKDAFVVDSYKIRGSDTLAAVNFLSAQDTIELSAAAVIGAPESIEESKKILPPSVIIGGSSTKTSLTSQRSAFILVYGLSPNAITLNDSNSAPPEAPLNLKSSGRTGTKQESQHFEEDIFSYISEGEMLSVSDSVSIFSDMNMSDTSGTFVMDSTGAIIGGGGANAGSAKKKISQTSQAQSKAGGGGGGSGQDGDKTKTDGVQSKEKEKEISLVQRIELPNDLKHCSFVRDIIPTLDGKQVIVSLECSTASAGQDVVFGALLTYKVIMEADMLKLEKQPVACRKFISQEEMPANFCMIPPEYYDSALACILRNGMLCILRINDLSLVKKIRRPDTDPPLTSISYVSSLERICCGTSRGTLEMYTLSANEVDLNDDSPTSATGDSSIEKMSTSPSSSAGVDTSKLIVNQKLSLGTMKQLMQLTSFDNIKPCFTVNVSSCWVRIIQAQKDRKHPQHLQNQDSEVSESTLSWRLQRTKNSKKEHVFEITLPKPARVGHFDLKFSLQPGCASLPPIEVTLYGALKTKSNKSTSSPSTSAAGEASSSLLGSKAVSNEFLKSINAVPVCGPLELGSHLDLSGQGGNVVMTSPTLVLNKGRNFYLHIRAKSLGKTDTPDGGSQESSNNANGSGGNKEQKPEPIKPATSSSSATFSYAKKSEGGIPFKTYKVKSKYHPQSIPKLPGSALTLKFSKEGTPFYELTPFGSQASSSGQTKSGVVGGSSNEGDAEKRKEYLGCDWLHEVSITIRKVKETTMPLEDHERKLMLTSDRFFTRLLDIAVFEGEEKSYSAQSAALDLLVWIAAVNLCGPQIGFVGYQTRFIGTVKQKLSALLLHGILFADRSTAHKCAKLLVLCIDAAESYGAEDKGSESFLSVLLNEVLKLLPYTISCSSAGSLQWFFLILNRVRNENLSLASETLLNLLRDVSKELDKRNEPLHSLLRTRFGLYGTPFEQELFEVEVPPFTRSYSHPLTYAGLCSADGANTVGSGTFHLWGLKDVDFRDLLVGNPLNMKWGKIGNLSPKQQIHGLLEVEPLHFTCHAASDGTRVEKIDLGATASSFADVPLPTHPLAVGPFTTNLPTGEGSKKSEPSDKVDQIMMLQKALKMDTSADAYYDVLSDLKFMEFPNTVGDSGEIAHIASIDSGTWKNAAGVLTMVMQPLLGVPGGGNPPLPPPPPPSSSTNITYDAFLQPASVSSAFFHKGSTPTPTIISVSNKPPALPPAPSAGPSKNNSTPPPAKAGSSGGGGGGGDTLSLLLSPWQQMMYVPPQQALVIDRMHSGARRFVVLDFGQPVLLTDMIIPACSDLVSLSIDIWLHREDTDGQRLVVASDIGSRSLVICDLQPPPVCRYLKITTIGRYGMGTTKCRIPLGMFYGHSTILPSDLRSAVDSEKVPGDLTVLTPTNVQAHLSVLSYLVEDIGCRYQLACTKLRRLLEPLMKPNISPLDHMSYYLPKGKERNKLGLNTSSDQAVLASYQECITLQQQLNVATNVMKRLQKCMTQLPSFDANALNPRKSLPEICTDKVHVLTEFLIESLLGISFIASSSSLATTPIPYSLYTNMTQETCEALFKEICILENGQCQLSTCTLMLRVCGCQPWWGKFLASTLKSMFSSNQNSIFPQDRVFILLVYLGQKSLLSAQNTSVLENAMELLASLLSSIEDKSSFLRSKIDMTLLGWVVMYLCLCLDGVNCTLTSSSSPAPQGNNGSGNTAKNKEKDVVCVSSRWDFIQGESALHRKCTGSSRLSGGPGFKRRIQKKLMATKQKLEELDNVAAGLGNLTQLGGLGNKLSALGNQIEAIKQKQASIGKTIKIQGSKHFLQMRRNELLTKRGVLSGKDMKDDSIPPSEVEINLNLSHSLCLSVAKGLALLLLRMDSTCHSDVYLIVCKALAKIATSCRPSIPLGAVFEVDQLVNLLCGSCGSDYVRERNWSSAWVSHATLCLIQDILEGEKLHPTKSSAAERNIGDDPIINTNAADQEQLVLNALDMMTGGVEDATQAMQVVEDMCVDSVDSDAVNEMLGMSDVGMTIESTVSLDSEDSDFEDLEVIEFGMIPDPAKCPVVVGANGNGKRLGGSGVGSGSHKKVSPCTTSISSALDARLESGVESTTEIRLRMMSVVDSEVLAQCLKAPLEVPPEILKNLPQMKKRSLQDPIQYSVTPSQQILASCFDTIFEMMASENCSINIGKVLQLWLTINVEYPGLEDNHHVKPVIPLSCKSLSSLMLALTKNSCVGIQEWGLAFQCLSLAANQKALNSTTGFWLYIMTDKSFPEIILKFISGSGINIQKNHVVSAGPTVCQHFYNFLLRLRQLSNDSVWTPCLKEVLLRVLGVFLSGPFLNSEFPLDAFNKFLDRITCPDLTYENPTTILSIIHSFASALHKFVFLPNKLNLRSSAELKHTQGGIPNPNAPGSTEATKQGNNNKGQTLETVMFRLATFMASVVSLPYKNFADNGMEVNEFLKNMGIARFFGEYEGQLKECVESCGDAKPKTIADIVLQMGPSMMRILSVLASPNQINVLGSDLNSAFNILDTASPATLVDAVIHLFSKLHANCSLPEWMIRPVCRFLSTSPYDDFYCPLMVSETFVLMVLKVISKEEYLKVFTEMKCVEAVCEKLVSSTKKFISSCPTFVSILTQYIGRTDANAIFGQKKYGGESLELQDGLINVAPLGSISSTNFSAHPSEVLLQAQPPHRRARTPVYSKCKENGFGFTTSPYEADAQLAKLAADGYIDLVITEDSDLVVFGCPLIFFKCDMFTGHGLLYDQSTLADVLGEGCEGPVGYDPDVLRRVCLAIGSDYSPGISGFGVVAARNLYSHLDPMDSVEDFILKVWEHLPNLEVHAEFETETKEGELAFKYHPVFDVTTGAVVPLEPYPSQEEELRAKAVTGSPESPLYHFFPEESYLELVITLPCAVLLREVQVIPHMTSLSTCPSSVMIEISPERNSQTLPLSSPVQCGGLSNISIQLVKPEVAQIVLLRLFKPKDSNNLGLSQIRLLGSTTFSESALQALQGSQDSNRSLEASSWLYILDRTINTAESNPQLYKKIIDTAVCIPEMLESCFSALVAPVAAGKAGTDVSLSHVASVLFHFGKFHKDVSEQLINALIGPVQLGLSHGMSTTVNSQGSNQLNTVVELLYKLCVEIPEWGVNNLLAVIRWLENCADEALSQNSSSFGVNSALPEYIQSVSAALWSVASAGKVDLTRIATPYLLKKLYNWSLKLEPKSELKSIVDHMICSIVFAQPYLFVYLMFSMNLIKLSEGIDVSGSNFTDLLQQWYDEGSVWGRVEMKDIKTLRQELHPSILMTLGRAAQSPAAANNLKNSCLLESLNAAIMDFWNFYNTSAWMVSNSVNHSGLLQTVITPTQFVGILTFYGELCKVNEFKNWFGLHASFWLPILNLLSTLPGSVKSSYFGTYVYDIESTVISFLAKCCWTHNENQKKIASCLREIILKQKTTPHKAVFLHSMSSFCRRLLIQLLLENEKIVVHIKSESKFPLKVPSSTLPFKDRHPSMGVSILDRVFLVSTQSTAHEMLRMIEPIGMKLDKSGNIIEASVKKDGLVEAGLEMIDHIFGVVAKENRSTDQKRLIKTAQKKLKISEGKAAGEISESVKKGPRFILELEEYPEVKVPFQLPLNTLLAAVQSRTPFLDVLVFSLRTEQLGSSPTELSPSTSSQLITETEESSSTGPSPQPAPPTASKTKSRKIPDIFKVPCVTSTVEVFSRMNGLALLAKHLPVVYPDTLRQIAVGGVVMGMDKDSPVTMQHDADFVKIESADDFYDDMLEMMSTSTPIHKKNAAFRHLTPQAGIPPHSMAAFGLFLSLPRFSEALLSDRLGAQCMLRLVMGVTDDADGNDIFGSAVALTLPLLPFQVLRGLLEALPLSTEEGRHLRRAMVEYKALHFILACLAVFTHQNCDPSLVPGVQHELVIAATKAQGGYEKNSKSDDKSHVYWAKGTGFGTGSTAQNWDVELAFQKKKAEEENVTCLLHVLSSYINPQATKSAGESGAPTEFVPPISAQAPGRSQQDDNNLLPPEMTVLLKNSCLFSAISGYLRNDSVLDMARHVPLYKSVLQFLRSLVSSSQLLPLLAPWERKSSSEEQSISALLVKMKDVVDNYSRRLTVNTKGKGKSKQSTKIEDLEDEGLALLIPDIQATASQVEKAVAELVKSQGPQEVEMAVDADSSSAVTPKTLEERYMEEMKKLQFSFYEMITEEEETAGIRFVVPYHYESNVRTNWGRAFPARLKRLAQESVTLSSSLPIAYGSTIFVRCDNDRLDVMKVLITGPSGTPYSNGCFEFDVFFPNDYPNSPMMINLETTGRQRIRFNPNLYTDGKVCLSILNTWHGRPEEKWNPQTSSLLPVLVAIQSLILNAEPYFNEPGYEKSRGTEAGERSSREYNAGIQIATVEWAMLDQIRNPSPCFKEVIHRHFWMKKNEVIAQCEKWLDDLIVTCKTDKRAGKNVTGGADPVVVFKNNLALLKKELMNMKPPEGLEDMADTSPRKNPSTDPASSANTKTSPDDGTTTTTSSITPPQRTSSQSGASVPIPSTSNGAGSSSSSSHEPMQTPVGAMSPPTDTDVIMKFEGELNAGVPATTVLVGVGDGDPMEEDDKVPMDM